MRFSVLERQRLALTKGAESRVTGRPVVAMRPERGGLAGTAYLAATGEPLPPRVEGRASRTARSSWSPPPGWTLTPPELHKIDMLFRENRLPLESGRARSPAGPDRRTTLRTRSVTTGHPIDGLLQAADR